MTNNSIKNRSELLFLYDLKDGNPNGDPLDENKPRIDENTDLNIVTDVRLKRTIRDYLMNYKGFNGSNGKDIFCREIRDEKTNYIQDAKTRAEDFLKEDKKTFKNVSELKSAIKDNLLNECIDVRLFGGTIPIELEKGKPGSSITYTGPVQFKIGRSLHKVAIKHIQGTGAFASKAETSQKTFREEDILQYSLIKFYGIINENAGVHTQLKDEDVKLLLDGMWNGTKNLISRTKAGQVPRLLLKVNYKNQSFHIGDIENLIKKSKKTEKRDEEIRDITEIILDITDLVNTLTQNKDKIDSIDLQVDDRLQTELNGNIIKPKDALKTTGITINDLNL